MISPTDCFEFNSSHVGPVLSHFMPVPNHLECQELCQNNVECDHFSFAMETMTCQLREGKVWSVQSLNHVAGPKECTSRDKFSFAYLIYFWNQYFKVKRRYCGPGVEIKVNMHEYGGKFYSYLGSFSLYNDLSALPRHFTFASGKKACEAEGSNLPMVKSKTDWEIITDLAGTNKIIISLQR